MNVWVNKQRVELEDNSSVISLLLSLGMNKRVAVWVNGKRLLQSEYNTQKLVEGDKIRVLRPLGGG